MKTNIPKREAMIQTHEGAPAVKEAAEKELTRTVSCLMLFEETFYESGEGTAKRINELCEQVSITFLCTLAVKARTDLKLRHAPLYLMTRALAKKGSVAERNLIGQTISDVIQRADELSEILAIYWKDGRKKVPRQLKAGIAKAFRKFSAYNLAKYNRDGAVKLRDALFISHAKPKDAEQAATWKKLAEKTLEAPDTWEVSLSAGADKKETFTRLLTEKKLGYMALLRNLRNMEESGVDRPLVEAALLAGASESKALPFRFVAAARFAPSFAATLSDAMLAAIDASDKLMGKTALLVDVSGSMDGELSAKSKLSRVDAACALAVLLREITPMTRVFQFGTRCREIPAYRGMGLVDAIKDNKVDHGTEIGFAVAYTLKAFPDLERMFVVTDMQSMDSVLYKGGFKGYYINTAPYEPAMPTFGGQWTIISGFSERIVEWVREEERK